MEYAFVGFLVPAEDTNAANNIILKINNIVYDTMGDLIDSYSIAAIPVLEDPMSLGGELKEIFNKYKNEE